MIDKRMASIAESVADIGDGASVMIGGFGTAGNPVNLVDALVEQGASGLTVIANNAGSGEQDLAALMAKGRVRRVICTFPRTAGSVVFADLYRQGKIELELVPQGTLSERIRAGGAGIAAFYTPTGIGTRLAEGKEIRTFDGVECVLEYGLRADVSLIRADRADRWGNLTYRHTARNFNPMMAAAGDLCIAEVREIVELGEIEPQQVVTPGIYVDRVVPTGERR
ncbi:MAG TPA: 3-oxoacid CoA-transferase subunit A [Alphaproteobacteria bacterium]|jgi:3-oxoadipate CoA-transferase alpha subunit|nr:3-oxoacid CoA-transferase subunit A [Alphaproteobacteria bacterium]MDP6271392.1 3-oxoacid CoA-transferase subunit A [Alphaproteobacteria bacterium]HJM51358.1 3-oxoacid CoA-transferase subunit A [Alphaproteobacteria bacterium]